MSVLAYITGCFFLCLPGDILVWLLPMFFFSRLKIFPHQYHLSNNEVYTHLLIFCSHSFFFSCLFYENCNNNIFSFCTVMFGLFYFEQTVMSHGNRGIIQCCVNQFER